MSSPANRVQPATLRFITFTPVSSFSLVQSRRSCGPDHDLWQLYCQNEIALSLHIWRQVICGASPPRQAGLTDPLLIYQLDVAQGLEMTGGRRQSLQRLKLAALGGE